ncbi:glycosyltransferase family 2 protein [Oleidesulfovibrio sp.]|uniref:glycosyltransferase family 2 protein n=1 Tax=Oleidesulfovibrio sp. TaxID=2909707 RepID=UPI003A8AA50C
MSDITFFSIVVPVFNEEDNLPVLYDEIHRAAVAAGKEWEVIFVDDGSKDRSLEVIKELAQKSSHVRFVALDKNSGQSAAFSAGFDAANGEVIITMDADLQNDPGDIPNMLREFERGFDMVIGWRAKRKDTFAKRIASKVGNSIRNWLSQETVRDTGCSLKVMRSSMAKQIPMFTGMHRFLPTLMKCQGATVSEVKVNHRPRLHGTSKYGIWDRARTTFFDLLAIRWMKKRYICYGIKEKN